MAAGGGAASKAVFLPPLTVTPPKALPPRIVPSSVPLPGASSTFDLGEGQRRWLVIGICLNKILLPTLRDFIKPGMQKHYVKLKTVHKIDKQTYSKHLKKDKDDLKYGSINNNEAIHRKKICHYDYCVKSDVDLAKLYLLPYMAKFSGFDDACDLSAVLGILSSASVFSAAVQNLSNSVKKDVRNEWGHCNFSAWDKTMFLNCFRQMESLVRCLKLSPVEEKRVTDELGDWETKGVQLCTGNMVDADLIKFVQEDVGRLLEKIKRLKGYQESEAEKITKALQTAQEAIKKHQEETKRQLETLQKSQESTSQKVKQLADISAATGRDMELVKMSQSKLKSEVVGVKQNQEAIGKRIDEGEKKIENLDKRVEELESAIETSSNRVINIFQAPNRIPCFHGRTEELLRLAQPLKNSKSSYTVTAVYGLGGVGKTSLAIEHIWENKEEYRGGVFWISGETNSLFSLSVSEMARQVGTFHEDLRTTLSKTLDWLQTRKDYWCLVIDNLDELELSTDMLKLVSRHWKRQAGGHILITTRREKKKLEEDISELAEESCIELKNLSETESVEFMKRRTEKSGDAEDVELVAELVVELGCLPLALNQAAAYIKNRKEISFSHYLKQYKAQRLKTLKRSKAHYPAQDTSKERIAVNTTWQLNFDYVSRFSEEYGIGQAAALVMEVSAFLSPDDIPDDVINQGLPQVDNRDLLDCLATTFGVTDILSILTNFSLFQKSTDESFSVHRLVQEVIRDKVIEDSSRLKEVLQCATRMLYNAFTSNRSPVQVCKSFQGDSVFHQDDPPSLYLWGKLGAHASVLQSHLIRNSQTFDMIRQELLYTEESVMVLNEASLYLSLCRQIKEAMKVKESKLNALAQLETPLTKEKLSYVTFFDIPLKDFEFKLISHCMAAHKSAAPYETSESEATRKRCEADSLRKEGNEAVKSKKYKEAIDLYTAAIECVKDDPRLYSNRALCELKLGDPEGALCDCESCLKLEERNSKALMRKAWALYELSKTQEKLKGRMRAAAALAVHVDPTLADNKIFSKMFPSVEFEEIFNPSDLAASFMYCVSGKTYLLHDGHYELHGAMLDVDMQLVALRRHQVTLKFDNLGVFQSSLYAEGLVFAKGSGGIICQKKGALDLLNCKISGGFSCCQDYPNCNGGPGCIADKFVGMKTCDRTGKYGSPVVSGIAGTSSVLIREASTCNLENCDVTRCGGKGIICYHKESILRVISCRVYENPQSGLEAIDGASLVAINNDIFANGFHGIFISPVSGSCQISNNRIYENKNDAILVCKTDAKVVIDNNRIYHNLGFGISLTPGSQVEVSQNEIFKNSFYGIGVMMPKTTVIEKNDIYSNKCGGIYIGPNDAGRILIDSNTVRDHSGSWLVNQNVPFYSPEENSPKIERKPYAVAPILKDNKLKNNEEGVFHPKKRLESIQKECAFCHQTKNLLRCSRCNIAFYCNKVCQEKHWNKHRALCSALFEQYSMTIELKKEGVPAMMSFGSDLKDIGKGPKPDPKSKRRFIVKAQTQLYNCHPLQLLTVYDKSLSVYGEFQSPEVFKIIMECGVLGKMIHFTSKKAFFYATFVNRGKQLNIHWGQLAPYQDW